MEGVVVRMGGVCGGGDGCTNGTHVYVCIHMSY